MSEASKAWRLLISDSQREEEEATSFIATPSNRIADNLSRANEKLGLITIDEDKGEDILEYNELFLKAKSEVLAHLKPSTSKALDILGSRLRQYKKALTAGGRAAADTPSTPIFLAAMSVSEFMKARGLKDRKQAKKELKEAGALAAETLITYNSERLSKRERKAYEKRGIKAFGGAIRLAKRWELSTSGIFSMEYTEEYAKLALAFPPMIYHRQLARLNDKKNPASYYIGRKLTELLNLRRVEAAKAKAPLSSASLSVSVVSLLEAAGGAIPTEGEVSATTRTYRHRIITPFERDLDALEELGSWEYCLSSDDGGGSVDRNTAASLPFPKWKELLIRFSFKGYLEEIKRREEAAKRMDDLEAQPAAVQIAVQPAVAPADHAEADKGEVRAE